VDSPILILGTNSTFPARLLVRSGGTEGGIDRQSYNLALGKHGLDVPPTVLREDETTSATLTGALAGGEFNKIGINGGGVNIEHELLGNFGDIGSFVGAVIILIGLVNIILLFLVLVIAIGVVVLIVHLRWRRGRRRRGHHFIVHVLRSVDKGATGSNGKLDGKTEVVGVDLATLESRGSASDLDGEDLGTVTLAAGADGLLTEVLNLGGSDLEVLDVLASKDDSSLEIVLVLDSLSEGSLGVGTALLTRAGEVENGVDGVNTLAQLEGLRIGRQSDGNTIEEMITKLSLIGIEGGNEEGLARVTEGETLTLDEDLTLGHNVEKDVGSLFVKEVDIIDVEDATMGLGKKTGRKHSLSGLDGLFKIGRTDETILHDVERDLHEGCVDDLGLTLAKRKAAVVKVSLGEIIKAKLAFGIDVEGRVLDDLNGREELVQSTGHNGLGRALATGYYHTTHAIVDGRKEQGLLDAILSDDHGKGERPTADIHQLIVLDARSRRVGHRLLGLHHGLGTLGGLGGNSLFGCHPKFSGSPASKWSSYIAK